MVIVTTSNDNGCLYCVVAHGAILRIRAKDALSADQVAVNYLKADISSRQKAMLTFALKISNNAQATVDEDFVVLKGHGFSESKGSVSLDFPLLFKLSRLSITTSWFGLNSAFKLRFNLGAKFIIA